jgi:5-methylcytosine-specific restriction endonuclease McrBC GTP-binding regulatory subunit McrB
MRRGDGLAWFVVLDEMNLAHVECYFDDLLSVMESGRDDEGWTREAMVLVYPETAEGDLPPREMRLPPNLYVVGTVNIDETTHAFSPKVLDRAFSIELVDVDFSDYPPAASGEALELSDAERQALLAAFTRNRRFPRIDKAEIAAYVVEHPDVRGRLQALNALLQRDNLHFGYRVFDEIVTFLAVAEENGMFDELGANAAFDAAVLMKVLPKFHGSRGKLERPLRNVLAWCLVPDDPQPIVSVPVAGGESDLLAPLRTLGYALPKTAERVLRMLAELQTDGFTAFG